MMNGTERPEDTVRRYARRMMTLRELHAPRKLDGDGFTSVWCRECRQNWPCPTINAMTDEAPPAGHYEYVATSLGYCSTHEVVAGVCVDGRDDCRFHQMFFEKAV